MRGFTLVEILVTAAIIALLTSVLTVYTRSQEAPLLLFREQSQLFSVINRAKSLSIQTFNNPDIPCGIGVRLEQTGRYFMFYDRASDCSSSDYRWQSGSDDTTVPNEDYMLDSKINFATLPVSDVVFVPPDPFTYLNGSLSFGEAQIRLQVAAETGLFRIITINNAGQVSTQ